MADFREKDVLMACREEASSLGYQTLKEEQLDVITSFVKGKDVFAVLPTGFGRSLCYGSLPGVSTVCTVLEVQ